MRKLISYPFFVVFVLADILLIAVFFVIQVLAYNIFGYRVYKKLMDLQNFFMVYLFYILLDRPSFYGFKDIPKNKPLIIVSNHQSIFDISPIIWGFRRYYVKFIAKAELGRIPSVSYNLKKSGSALIDRDNNFQAIKEIVRLGKDIEKNNNAVCIFPEGTRSKDGRLKEFNTAGLKTLLRTSPSAVIIPFVIDGNYKLLKWGGVPLNIGIKLRYTALDPIDRDNLSDKELLEKVKNKIQKHLEETSSYS